MKRVVALVGRRPYERASVSCISLLESLEPFMGESLMSGFYVTGIGQEVEEEDNLFFDWGSNSY